jgi:sugar lactone lactonase YvrE/tetratricopeptide (TPR) repeat protein
VQLTRLSTIATWWGPTALLAVVLWTPLFGQAVPKASYEANGSFQLPGKGQPGAPDKPIAMALGPGGTVHIADDKGLVFVFDASGVYQRTYGQAELDNPVAVEVTSENVAYVLDAGRKQIFVYGPGGQALRALSRSGAQGGQLSSPVDMDLGPNGYVYVLDQGRQGVQIFSRDGLFVRDIQFGESIRKPLSMAVGIDGRIYIADDDTQGHIFVLQPFTQLPWSAPLPRGIAGQVDLRGGSLQAPVATIVNELGTLVILDQRTGRLWRKNAAVTQDIGSNDLLYGGSGTGRGSFSKAEDIVFSSDEHVLILDSDQRKVERIRLSTEEGLRRLSEFRFPIRVTRVERSLPQPLLDVVYTTDGLPVFLFDVEGRAVTMIGTQPEIHETVYGDSVPAYLPDPSVVQVQFSRDIGRVAAATATDQHVLIADSRRNRFSVFGLQGGDPEGTYGDNYEDNRRLRSPSGLAMLSDGRVVVADNGNDRVKVFSSDLASLVASYQFRKPAGVAVSPDDRIYAWSEDGTQLGRLNVADEVFEPLNETLVPGPVASVTFDQAGNLFILDRDSHRVTIVDDDLSKIWIQLGAEAAFDEPNRVNVDREGNIYISDPGAGRSFEYRWDVDFPPIAGLDMVFETETAVLTWRPGPAGFIRGYEIQGADQIDGPYRVLARTAAPPYRIDPEARSEDPPRYVRVTPVYITGVRGKATASLPLSYFTASAAFQRQDYQTARREATEGLRLMDEGILASTEDSKGRLLYIAFSSSYALGEFTQAVEIAQQLSTIRQPNERLIPFLFQLAEIYLRSGNATQASQTILTLVGQGPRPEYYTEPSVVNQSFLVYRRLRETGSVADALEFIRLYTQSMPATVQNLKDEYTDSIIVYSTRDKLGPGFEYWSNADYGAVVTFYESLLTQGGLTIEQTIVSRQVLAVAYYAYGRRVEAEDTFREIFNLRPQFDLNSEIPRIRQLYGLILYNPDTERFFGALRPR